MIVGLVALMVALSACSVGKGPASPTVSQSSPEPSAVARTHIVYVRPTLPDHSLKPGYRVTRTETTVSACWPYDTAGVIRCDSTRDEPQHYYCWKLKSDPGALKSVACLDSPWSKTVTRMVLPKGMPLPTPDPVTPGLDDAIALKLTDGQRCQALYGALDPLDDSLTAPSNTYSCSKVDLFGAYRQTKPFWTIKAAYGWDGNKYKRLTYVPIAVAYFVAADS